MPVQYLVIEYIVSNDIFSNFDLFLFLWLVRFFVGKTTGRAKKATGKCVKRKQSEKGGGMRGIPSRLYLHGCFLLIGIT